MANNIKEIIAKAQEDMCSESRKLSEQYNKSISELRCRIINTLPLKVGDVLTRYSYAHFFNREGNPPTGKEKVLVSHITIDTDGLIWFKYRKWSDKTNKWLKGEIFSGCGVGDMMCVYEKDNIFYTWNMTVQDGHQGYDLPTHDMEIPNV
jgi:hypothetical protein